MKKMIVLFLGCILMFSGCGNTAANETTATTYTAKAAVFPEAPPTTTKNPENAAQLSSGDVIEIKEKMFIAQINDIYYNFEDYMGKTIKYEGIYNEVKDAESGEMFRSVTRFGPGCCGIDENPGFEVYWDEEYPYSNDWVEAAGILEEYEYDGFKYYRLALTSLTVLSERGEEYVDQ